jgi:hypothetical protein
MVGQDIVVIHVVILGQMVNNMRKTNYTQIIEQIAKDLNIPEAVAMDIEVLRSYEDRIVCAYRKNNSLRDFDVENINLENQLLGLDRS